ncbi:SCO family protein [Altererythrobacter arenosus]|uniref:SCO family protein n=2 Tax=Altererythrobacter arenosus TaxID=3032592 RepID=A0ABY8FT59_9SPHN|nr:SCO family protein [Altererythrobacter sp. CAU 1644]WFL78207.1 SCO family protein [Altererythrobacter sp. CAU 1644]
MNQLAMPVTKRNLLLALIGASLLGLTACGDAGSPQGSAAEASMPPLQGADIGGEFELVDKNGKSVRWSDFDGKYRTVYFGFTYCPDVCPTDVQRAMRGLKQLAQADPGKAAKIQPIFISVDPERDTPEAVGQFTAAFSDDLVGLTGTPEQVKAVADAFRVYYERGEEQDGGGYLVNHSAITYLFGPKGEPLATLPTDQGPEAVAAELAKWVN